MAQPTVVCLERCWPESARPFVRCVALPGRAPGLGLAHDGSLLWKATEGVACSLGVSSDDQLILVRSELAPSVRLSRSGRSLQVQPGKLVVLLHGDELEFQSVRWRVHIHGPARDVAAPRTLSVSAWATAAAVAVAALTGCTTTTPASSVQSDASAESSMEAAAADAPEVDASMDAGEDETDAAAEAAGEAGADAEAGVDAAMRKTRPAASPTTPRSKKPIEVRDFPPFSD